MTLFEYISIATTLILSFSLARTLTKTDGGPLGEPSIARSGQGPGGKK